MRRFFVVAAALLITFAFDPNAWAQTGTCSDTNLAPGDPISVSGSGAVAGETGTLQFNGAAIGATTVNGFGHYSVSGSVPASTPPGTYTISVVFSTSGTITPCNVTVQDEAPDPDEDEDEDDDDEDDDEDDDGQQQQQQGPFGGQQQQQGGGGGQQQQQQVVVPASFAVPERVVHHSPVVSGTRSLPKTGLGIDLEDVTGVSTGSLLVGLSLMELARRHRRRRPGVATASDGPVRSLCEADLLWPRWDEPR